jgi:hypothetical protein
MLNLLFILLTAFTIILSANKWKKLLEPQILIPSIIVPFIIAIIGMFGGFAPTVNIVDAGSKAIPNEEFNPFEGVWQPTQISGAPSDPYPQIILKKDDFGRIWLDLYQHCTKPNCLLGQFPAEIKNDIITAKHAFQNWSFVLTAKMQDEYLDVALKAVQLNGSTEPVTSVYTYYERVLQEGQTAID